MASKNLTELEARGLAAALEQAQISVGQGGMPFGAALIVGEEIVATGHNTQIQTGGFFAHAEMVALEKWFARNTQMLQGATLIATEAPCLMCAGAAFNSGIREFIIGEDYHFAGAITTLEELGAQCRVVDDADCIELVTAFRADTPELWTRFSAG